MTSSSDSLTTVQLDAALAKLTSTVVGPLTTADSNATVADEGSADTTAHTAGYYAVLLAMMALMLTAVGGNVCNMLVIVRSSHLRHSLSNFFVISLCTCDLLAATLVMPVAAFTFALGAWPLGGAACSVAGFATSLFMFVSTTTLSVISVER